MTTLSLSWENNGNKLRFNYSNSSNDISLLDIFLYSKTKITSVGKNNLPTQPFGFSEQLISQNETSSG